MNPARTTIKSLTNLLSRGDCQSNNAVTLHALSQTIYSSRLATMEHSNFAVFEDSVIIVLQF